MLSDAWLSVSDTARTLGCSRNDVLRLIEENELAEAIDIRGKGASRACLRIPTASINSFLEKRQATNAKLRSKRARISPTQSCRRDPASALLAAIGN